MQYGMENVGVWRRAVAVILDLIIIWSVTEPIWATSGIFSMSTSTSTTGQIVPNAIQFYANPWGGLLVAVIPIIYFTLMEGFFGATAGKMLLGLRVVQLDGSPITWREAIVRNLLRAIDSLVLYLVGAIAIWVSPMKQRLGDRAAETVVIRRVSIPVPQFAQVPEAPMSSPLPGTYQVPGSTPPESPIPSQR